MVTLLITIAALSFVTSAILALEIRALHKKAEKLKQQLVLNHDLTDKRLIRLEAVAASQPGSNAIETSEWWKQV